MGALGEDVIVLADLALELEGAAVKAGQDWVSAASGIAVTVAVTVAGADISNSIAVTCMITVTLSASAVMRAIIPSLEWKG